MADFQLVVLGGHLGQDPDIRYQPSGDAVANFSVATSRRWKDHAGEIQERTEWHRIVVWGKQVEAFVAPYLKKGSPVVIRGELRTRSWEKDGVTRYTTEIHADQRGGVIGQRTSVGQEQAVASTERPASQGNAKVAGGGCADSQAQPGRRQDFDDDIPF